MADLRTARRTAEQLARDALGGTLLGAAGELGVALARRAEAAEAAEAIAAAAERAREIAGRRGRHRLRGRLAGGHHRRLGAGPAARHGLPQAGHTPPAGGRPGTDRAGTRRRALPRRRGGRLASSAMALRPTRAVRGWWRYSRLVGWQLAVLAVAAGSSVLRAAGVADRPGPEWTTLAAQWPERVPQGVPQPAWRR